MLSIYSVVLPPSLLMVFLWVIAPMAMVMVVAKSLTMTTQGRFWWRREPGRVHLWVQLPLPSPGTRRGKVRRKREKKNSLLYTRWGVVNPMHIAQPQTSKVPHCGRASEVESLQVLGNPTLSFLAFLPGFLSSRSWTTRPSLSPLAAATRRQGVKFLPKY